MSDCRVHEEQIKQNAKKIDKLEMKVDALDKEFSENKATQIQTQTMVTVLVEEMQRVVRKLDVMTDRLTENDKKTDETYAFVSKLGGITWDTVKKAVGYIVTALITAALVGFGMKG